MRIVIAGGGIAAVEALLAIAAVRDLDAKVTLTAPDAAFVFRPSAPAVPYRLARPVRIPLAELAAAHGATFRRDRLTAVEGPGRVARTAAGAALAYDALVIAVGARHAWTIPGAVRYSGTEDEQLAELLSGVDAGELERIAFAVPAGFTWPLPAYELAVLTTVRARARGRAVQATVATPERAPLAALGATASERASTLLRRAGVRTLAGLAPQAYARGRLTCGQMLAVEVDAAVQIPRLSGPATSGLPTDAEGFIETDAYGRVRGVPDVYAAGDAIVSTIKHGELAARQADTAVDALTADAGLAVEPRPVEIGFHGALFTGLIAHRLTDPAGRAEPWAPSTQAAGRHLPRLIEQAGRLPDPEAATPADWIDGA